MLLTTQAALDSFIASVFSPSNYASGAVLATDHKGQALVTLPDSLSRQVLVAHFFDIDRLYDISFYF